MLHFPDDASVGGNTPRGYRPGRWQPRKAFVSGIEMAGDAARVWPD